MDGITLVLCYVLINTKPQYEHDVYNTLRKKSEVIEITPLFQEFDLIAKVKVDTPYELGKFIASKVRSHNGVVDAKTLQ